MKGGAGQRNGEKIERYEGSHHTSVCEWNAVPNVAQAMPCIFFLRTPPSFFLFFFSPHLPFIPFLHASLTPIRLAPYFDYTSCRTVPFIDIYHSS